MTGTKPVVIVTRKLPDVIETRMMELFDTRLNDDDRSMTQAQLIEAVQSADVLVPTVTDRIDKGVLAQANPDLRLVANFGTGVDNIDLAAANKRAIMITNTPGVLTEDTADMTMALILAAPRRLAEGDTNRHGRDRAVFGCAQIFRMGAVGPGGQAEDLVARLEGRHLRANALHLAGEIEA